MTCPDCDGRGWKMGAMTHHHDTCQRCDGQGELDASTYRWPSQLKSDIAELAEKMVMLSACVVQLQKRVEELERTELARIKETFRKRHTP